MKVINLKQGSIEWLRWRMTGIGASEAAAVLGVSKWQTPTDVWGVKTMRTPSQPMNWAMRRGRLLEPEARRIYERATGLSMPPLNVEHPSRPHVLASLDGANRRARRILEIKIAGREDHETARRGQIPAHYIPQLEQQLAAHGEADSIDYMSFNGRTHYIVTFFSGSAYRKALLASIDQFWNMVLTDTAPELIDLDYSRMRKKKDPASAALYKQWRVARIFTDEGIAALHRAYGCTAGVA